MTPGVLLPATRHTIGLSGPSAPSMPIVPHLARMVAEGSVVLPPVCQPIESWLTGPTAMACRHIRAVRMTADRVDFRFRGTGLRVKLMAPSTRAWCEDWS